ncbi:MAG: hypothetical protein ACRDSF_00095 [Pseudonocardiaceae bacterium]
MARTDVTSTKRVPNSSIVEPTGTTIDATLVTNGVRIVSPDWRSMEIIVANTAGADKVVTIQSGDSLGGAIKESQGDLTVTVVATTGIRRIGPLESSRFSQADGSCWVDFGAGTTGTIKVVQLP